MLINIGTIVDFSYAWIAVGKYQVLFQQTIKNDAKAVLMLKTVFLKLSTIMEKPLQRILQAGSEDFASVAKYYSGQLFDFVKSTLYVIPVNIFKELNDISRLLSMHVKEFEVKISKDLLKESVNVEQRFTLARKTHEITLLTEGMLVLDNVLMGVIEIDPKEILVDGLRKELCKTLANMLHREFIFTGNVKDLPKV